MNKLVEILLATVLVIGATGSAQAASEWKFSNNDGAYVSNPSETDSHKMVDGIDL